MRGLWCALLAGSLLGSGAFASSGAGGACAPGRGGVPCARVAAEDSSSMLSLRRSVLAGALQNGENRSSSAHCPVSGMGCTPGHCCPGVKFTVGKTFPCPGSAETFGGCEVNTEEEIVQALVRHMKRADKYKMLRGVGWQEGGWDNFQGFYIGNSGIGLLEDYGIPSLNMHDNGQGFRTVSEDIIHEVTGWPSALAVSASWSEHDTNKFGRALGKEFRRKHANVILGPGVNVHRVARGGRNAEYISGESPYLGARLAKQYVKGVQSEKVLAVMKHFVGNSQENNRNTVNSIVDARTLHEVYYPPFEAAVEAGCAAAMCAYNIVNGIHACGNGDILLSDLKGEMKFDGFVQSDWWAMRDFAAEGGVDQEMPGTGIPDVPKYFTNENLDTLSDEKINDMVVRQLRMIYRHRLWQDPVCQPSGSRDASNNCFEKLYEVVATDDTLKAFSKELATKSVVLLKNDEHVLPLSKVVETKIALLGPACDAPQSVDKQLGKWDLGSYYNIGGSGRVIAESPTTILAGVQAACARDGAGCSTQYFNGTDAAAGLAFVKQFRPSVVLLCGGASSTEDADRSSLSIDDEVFFIDMVAHLTTALPDLPVVALTMIPAQTLMPWIDDVAAALTVFLSGTYTGDAFAAVLFGDSNPSAKLPITLPKSEADTIFPCTAETCAYVEKLYAGFPTYEGVEVNFPFGHGLSYTTFGYFDLQVLASSEGSIPAGCNGADIVLCVSATVKNTGARKGVEVAQLYLGFPESADEPPKLLRGFERTKPLAENGGEVNVFFPLRKRDVQIWRDPMAKWVMPDGVFRVYVGSSSRDIRLEGAFGACEGALSKDSRNAC